MVRLGLVLAVTLSPAVAAANDAGRVISLRGEATLTRSDGSGYRRLAVERGIFVKEGDQLRTRSNAAVRIVFDDRSLLNIGPNASMVIQQYRVGPERKKRSVGIKLWAGRAWARVTGWFGGETSFEVRTPNAVAGVRGTEFSVDVQPNGETRVTVYEGAVEVSPPSGGERYAMLNPGERSTVGTDGDARTETVPAAQLRDERRASQRNGGLDPNRAEQRLQQAADQLERAEPPRAPKNPAERAPPPTPDEAELAPAAPPLDLDPASGESRVRGRVEIRE